MNQKSRTITKNLEIDTGSPIDFLLLLGHGREHAICVFFSEAADVSSLKRLIDNVLYERIDGKIRGGPWLSLGLDKEIKMEMVEKFAKKT